MSIELGFSLLTKHLLATVWQPVKIAHSKFISALRGISVVKFCGSKIVIVILNT